MDAESVDIKSDTLSYDILQLDDEEYNIPALDETPTLESILNDDDVSVLSDDELAEINALQFRSNYDENADVSSVGSFSMYRSGRSGSPLSSAPVYKYDPGNILRHSTLKTVSAQLRSACERINAGYPSVLTVSTIMAIGTSNGLILVFDTMHTLRWCYEGDIDQSSVSALGFNHDCSRLLAGYARGAILMFDVADGRVLRTMNEVHTPCTAVLHLKFTDISSLAICSDSGGSVFELNFKRTFSIRGVDSRCIFSGSRGEVCCIEPLLLHHLNSHPLNGSVLLAMATLTKLILVSIRPHTKLLLTHTVKSNPRSLPILSWQFVVIQVTENSRIMDPVLAFARDQTIHFYQVNICKGGKLRCTALQKLELDYSLLTCHWLNTRTIAAMDINEQMHLLDVRTKQELETIDLSAIGLVYSSSHFKGLATDGNVSKAMALAGERACYNTVQSYGTQIILLGLKSCHIVSIRNWIERLDTLVDKGRFEDALRLGIEFLEEKGKVVLGLRGPHHQRYNLVKDKVIDILITYIDVILTSGRLYVSIADAIGTIIDTAIDLEQINLLYKRVWEGFEYNGDNISRDTFLKGISAAIIDGKITNVPPEIVQQLINYLSDTYQWKELEICILNTDIECLDIQQVLQLSRQHSLHNALISIWNRAMQDYTSPLAELLPKLQSSIQNGVADYARDLGNKLLVYISCCFSGRAYPRGDLEPSQVEAARGQVFQFLCTQHTINANQNEHIYPYLRILLKFDIKEFLNVLSMAFANPRFTPQLKQRLVDILILVVIQSKRYEAYEMGWLCLFLRRQTLNNITTRPITVDVSLYDKVVASLAEEKCSKSYEERQQAFLDLILADNFQHFQEDQMLLLARNAEFYKVCSIIHEKAGEHGQVVRCYLLDNVRKHEVFDYIDRSAHKEYLRPYIVDNIDSLLDIDNERTGITIGKHYADMVPNIVLHVSDSQMEYFLKGALQSTDLDSALITQYMSLLCKSSTEEQILEFVNAHDNLHLEHALMASREHNMDRVTAKLLERQGDYQGAFDVLFSRLQRAIQEGRNVEDPTEELVSLVHRGSAVLHPKKTWLPLLQCLLNLNSRNLLKRVLHSADLSLATELHLLLQHTSGTLGDFRNLIMGLVDKCTYELSVLKCVSRVAYRDMHHLLADEIRSARRGISSPQSCSICQHSFTNNCLLFRCGHGYHSECVQTSDTGCIICCKSPTSCP